MSLPSSMADFVPCDRLLQKTYCPVHSAQEQHEQNVIPFIDSTKSETVKIPREKLN